MLLAKDTTVAVEAAASHGHYPRALSPQIQLEFAEAEQGVSALHFPPCPQSLQLCVGSHTDEL